MHHERVGLGQCQACGVEAEDSRILAQAGEQSSAQPLALNAQHHHDAQGSVLGRHCLQAAAELRERSKVRSKHLAERLADASKQKLRTVQEYFSLAGKALRFAFVRDPYDRIFSAWKQKIVNSWDTRYAGLRDQIRTANSYPSHTDRPAPAIAFRDFVRFVAVTMSAI